MHVDGSFGLEFDLTHEYQDKGSSVVVGGGGSVVGGSVVGGSVVGGSVVGGSVVGGSVVGGSVVGGSVVGGSVVGGCMEQSAHPPRQGPDTSICLDVSSSERFMQYGIGGVAMSIYRCFYQDSQ
jgi:hypothetical protein